MDPLLLHILQSLGFHPPDRDWETAIKYAECVVCGEEYNYKRKELGYNTCLECGARSASRIIAQRTRENLREMAPHSFTGSVEDMFDDRDF